MVVETKDGLEPASNAAADGVSVATQCPHIACAHLDYWQLVLMGKGPVPWIPALASDTLHPPPDPDTAANAGAVARDDAETCPNKHEPLLHVKAVETGVIDVSRFLQHCRAGSRADGHNQLRLMVQECFAKTGVQQLQAVKRD